MPDQEQRTPYFGDYPRGSYWSAVPPDVPQDSDREEDYAVEGSTLRIMWDEGAGPLWASDGCFRTTPSGYGGHWA